MKPSDLGPSGTNRKIGAYLAASQIGRETARRLATAGEEGSVSAQRALEVLESSVSMVIDFDAELPQDLTPPAPVSVDSIPSAAIEWWFEPPSTRGFILDPSVTVAQSSPLGVDAGRGEWWSEPLYWRRPSGAMTAQVSGCVDESNVPIFAHCTDMHISRDEVRKIQSDALYQPVNLERLSIYEVNVPSDWVNLVAEFPRRDAAADQSLPIFRRFNRSVQPDWERVAERYDAVRVSVGGFVQTAYQMLPLVESGDVTVLAGWNPGEMVVFDKHKLEREAL